MGAPFGFHRWLAIAAVMAGVALPAHGETDVAGPAPSLAFPVDCKLSDTCFIQFHVDLAPGPEIGDYKCARLTYDGHKGTDIRLPDYPSMRAGVAVLAATDGVVRAIREGEPDISLDVRGMDDLGGKDAGNAVVIVHSEGWETQYSHMMRGSVVVKAGDQVKQGQVLGKIGLSGRSNFPHLDFSVRRKGEIIDPFLGGEPNMNCERLGSSLWTEAARAIMPYQPGGVLLAGFASVEPDKTAVRDGASRALTFTSDAPLLVFYTDVYGILAGDRETLIITAPDGREFARHEGVLETDMPQRFTYARKKRPRQGWQSGLYRGEYRLTRIVGGETRVIATTTREATISER